MGASNLWNVEDTGSAEPFPKCLCKDTDASTRRSSTRGGRAPFPRCPWAVDLSDKTFPGRKTPRPNGAKPGLNSLGEWFWESGFDRDPIDDVEWMRDLNFRAMYGAWDTLKNVDKLYPNHKLAWAAYIAGKRESRRLLGDVVLTADDFRTGRRLPDGCFPCTWGIDLHTPEPAYQKGNEGNEFISRATTGARLSPTRAVLGPVPLPLQPERAEPVHGRPRHQRDARGAGPGPRDADLRHDGRDRRHGRFAVQEERLQPARRVCEAPRRVEGDNDPRHGAAAVGMRHVVSCVRVDRDETTPFVPQGVPPRRSQGVLPNRTISCSGGMVLSISIRTGWIPAYHRAPDHSQSSALATNPRRTGFA